MLISQLLFGGFLIGLTVVVHAFALDFLFRTLVEDKDFTKMRHRHFKKVTLLTCAVLGVFCANIIEMWIWVIAYMILHVPAVPTLESALYFSISSFTTLGMGDIVLGEQWRVLSAIEGANGMILFGWSTAFIFEVMAIFYGTRRQRITPKTRDEK